MKGALNYVILGLAVGFAVDVIEKYAVANLVGGQ